MGKGKAVWTATRKALTDLFTTSDGESPKRMSRPPCNSLRSAALRSTVRFDSFHLSPQQCLKPVSGLFAALKNDAEMRKAAFYPMGEVEMVLPAVRAPQTSAFRAVGQYAL